MKNLPICKMICGGMAALLMVVMVVWLAFMDNEAGGQAAEFREGAEEVADGVRISRSVVSEVAEEAAEEGDSAARHEACGGCGEDHGGPVRRIEMAGGARQWLVGIERSGTVRLPDGREVGVVIEGREVDDDGELLMVEGRIASPAGRFLFRRETEPGLAWPMWGFVRFIEGETAFQVENEGARSFLSEVSVDLVLCRNLESARPEAADAPDGEDGMRENIPADHPTSMPIPEYQNGVVPLQSLPGALAVVYLDFDGEKGPHEAWGDIDAASFNLGNTQIKDLWQRVAEDYAPFQINVTTDLAVFLAAPKTSRMRCIITPTDTASPGAGGTAYRGSFSSSGDIPCWCFFPSGKAAADIITHEVGHTLGLAHDGRISPAQAYYSGHGVDPVGWAPIMGIGYYKNLVQWSKGEYLSANNLQDDLAIILGNNNVQYRADDTGSTLVTAKYLEILANNTVEHQGIIETGDDIDAFRFKTAGGSVSLTVNPAPLSPNLDILTEIRNAANVVVASANPLSALNATLNVTLAAGEYTLQVSGVGRGDPLGDGYTDYGSLGAYTITGTIHGAVKPDRFTLAENPPSGAVVGGVTPRNNHGGSALAYAISSSTPAGAFAIHPATGQLTVANPALCDYEAVAVTWDSPADCELFVAITNSVNPSLNETVRVVVTLLDVNEPPVLAGGVSQTPAGTRAGTRLLQVTARDPDHFQEFSATTVFSISGGNAAGYFAIDPATGWITVATPPPAGSHSLVVTGTDATGQTAAVTTAARIDVYGIPQGYSPGAVYRTIYDGITGSTVAALTSHAKFPNAPDREIALEALTDTSRGDNYGSTVRAWIFPPVTGSYTFWVAGADDSQLLLSNTASTSGATIRASFSGFTSYQQWNKYAGQKSAAISLTAGQAYYLEVRHKEATLEDHIAVAWEASAGGSVVIAQQVIDKRYLAPHVINIAPTLAAAAAKIYDSAYNGATVAALQATDANAGQTHAYVITAGNAAGVFGIDSATGRVFVADASKMNAAATPSHTLTVSATDNGTPPLSGGGTLTVQVLAAAQAPAADPNTAPVFAAGSYSFEVPVTAPAGTHVGTVTATDTAAEQITYAILSGNPGGFAIHSQSGKITLSNPAAVTAGQIYALQIGAQDDGLGKLYAPKAATVTASIRITGTPPNQAPVVTITRPAVSSVSVAGGNGMLLEAAVTDDGRPSSNAPVLSWTTAGGPATAVFSHPGSASTDVRFPVAGTYVLRLTADDGELTTSASLTVTAGVPAGSGTLAGVDAGSDATLGTSGGFLAGTVAGGMVSTVSTASFIDAGSPAWRFRKGTSEASSPTSAWRGGSFAEDATWHDGRPGTGYGGKYTHTTLLGDMKGLYTSVFFRHSFEIDPARIPDQLTLKLFIDDGAIVWINGVEVARCYMTAGEKAFTATSSKDRTATWETFTLANSRLYLKGGRNQLAVHGFNRGKANGDFAFNASLETSRLPGAPATAWRRISGPGAVDFADPTAADTGVAFSEPGSYVLRLTATDDVASTFDEVKVQVVEGMSEPNAPSPDSPLAIGDWKLLRFKDAATDPAVAANDADPDKDGMPNLMEYALGLDPLAADPPADLPHSEFDGETLSLVYRRNLLATGVEWVVERCPCLATAGAWTPADPLDETVSDDGKVRVVRASVPTGGAPALFLRLMVRETGQ